MNDDLLKKIGKLLRKAENTDNSHEAEAFQQAAQRLATQYSIDLAIARAHADKATARQTPIVRQIQLGKSGKRGLATYVNLFTHIGYANDLVFNVAHDSSYVIAFGFAEDIDATEVLYAGLVVQMVAASDAYIKSGKHREELVWSDRLYKRVPVHGVTARINFQSEFARVIGHRLMTAKRQAEAKVVETTAGTDLVLVGKSVEVRDFYKTNSKARGSWKGSRATFAGGARQAGAEAGRNARLGQGSLSAGRKALR